MLFCWAKIKTLSKMIRRFEEISMNAFPSLQTLVYDGWILRFGNGVTRRANSIVPLYDSTLNIASKLNFCEEIYKEHKLPVLFKMTSCVFPSNLDTELENRGYTIDAETSFQTLKEIEYFSIENDCDILIDTEINDNWLQKYMQFNNHEHSKYNTFRTILNQIKTKKCLLEIVVDKKVIGCGLGVIESNFIGLFDIVVDFNYRQKGFGEVIVKSLLNWGKEQGAKTAYLQVMIDNPPALKLYKKLGFKEEYKYWYRIKK
jgi:N-acetylglutamate synthase